MAALGRDDEAKVLLERARMVIDMRGGVVQGLGGTREDQEACRRLELLGCELFNLPTDTEREVEDALLEARLDARSPDNLTLIGKALMARGGRIAGQLELTSPERSLSDAIRRLKEAPDSLPSLGLQGSAFLRQGRLDRAQVVFRQLRERDASYWPASLGLGAVMRFRRFRLWAALEDLDVYPEPVGLEAVVPDWPALSEEERRVVLASVHPLRFALPILVEAGVCIRVLPLDVRVSDLEELAWTEGLRGAQGQDLSTTSGLATTRLAVVRVEELLDTASPYSWTFGHELAHLALFHLPQEDRERVRALYDRALEHPHVTSWYQASNLDEFFAVSYERWLGFRYQRPLATMADTVGISASIIALFEELMGREP